MDLLIRWTNVRAGTSLRPLHTQGWLTDSLVSGQHKLKIEGLHLVKHDLNRQLFHKQVQLYMLWTYS